jgi:hypothetical protein
LGRVPEGLVHDGTGVDLRHELAVLEAPGGVDAVAEHHARALTTPGAATAFPQEGGQVVQTVAPRASLKQLAHDGRRVRVNLKPAIRWLAVGVDLAVAERNRANGDAARMARSLAVANLAPACDR